MDPFRRRPSSELELELDPSNRSSGTRMRAAPRATGSSGQYITRYGQIRDVLLRYLSPILVDSVLERAMRARNLSPMTLSDTTLAEITSDIMVGLRLFVPEERLSQLMLELAETLDSEHA